VKIDLKSILPPLVNKQKGFDNPWKLDFSETTNKESDRPVYLGETLPRKKVGHFTIKSNKEIEMTITNETVWKELNSTKTPFVSIIIGSAE